MGGFLDFHSPATDLPFLISNFFSLKMASIYIHGLECARNFKRNHSLFKSGGESLGIVTLKFSLLFLIVVDRLL